MCSFLCELNESVKIILQEQVNAREAICEFHETYIFALKKIKKTTNVQRAATMENPQDLII